MIAVRNLVKSYKNHAVLKGLNLTVKTGEIYGFIGPNGAGKSTTMNIIAGLITFNGGSCIVNGKDVVRFRGDVIREVGYLPEEPRFYDTMTGREYLHLLGRLSGYSTRRARERTDELLETVTLTEAASRRIGGYSRGMKQRLGLAAALFADPALLLLDEPSSALDPEGRRKIVDIIDELKKTGKTIFLSTHILSDIERICDRIGILNGGRIVLEEDVEVLEKGYLLPVYDIDCSRPVSGEVLNAVGALPFVRRVESDGARRFSVWFDPDDDSKIGLLGEISRLAVPVDAFNPRRSTLEEIFLMKVGNNE